MTEKVDILKILGERPAPACELCGEPYETQTSLDAYGTRYVMIYCVSCGRKERQEWRDGRCIQKTLVDGVVVRKKPKDTRSIWEQRVALVIDEV